MILSTDARLRALLGEVLALPPARVAAFGPDTELFGALPELDSLALGNLLGAIELRFAVTIHDDEVHAEHFITYGALAAFVQSKLAG